MCTVAAAVLMVARPSWDALLLLAVAGGETVKSIRTLVEALVWIRLDAKRARDPWIAYKRKRGGR